MLLRLVSKQLISSKILPLFPRSNLSSFLQLSFLLTLPFLLPVHPPLSTSLHFYPTSLHPITPSYYFPPSFPLSSSFFLPFFSTFHFHLPAVEADVEWRGGRRGGVAERSLDTGGGSAVAREAGPAERPYPQELAGCRECKLLSMTYLAQPT